MTDALARAIPLPLASALRRAHAAELTAIGAQRRRAFRLTRALLGGARRAGYPPAMLAECVGVSVGSVRTRGGSDGWVRARVFAELAGLTAEDLQQWADAGLLIDKRTGDDGEDHYLASVLVRALSGSAESSAR